MNEAVKTATQAIASAATRQGYVKIEGDLVELTDVGKAMLIALLAAADSDTATRIITNHVRYEVQQRQRQAVEDMP